MLRIFKSLNNSMQLTAIGAIIIKLDYQEQHSVAAAGAQSYSNNTAWLSMFWRILVTLRCIPRSERTLPRDQWFASTVSCLWHITFFAYFGLASTGTFGLPFRFS